MGLENADVASERKGVRGGALVGRRYPAGTRRHQQFVEMARQEIRRLNEDNIARHRIRLSEYWTWFRAQRAADVGR
jgi:hypothetical protein